MMGAKKKIAIIGTNGVPAKYGGFETLTQNLIKYLDKNSLDITVYCSNLSGKNKPKTYNGANLIYFPFKANGWQSLFYDFFSILHGLIFSDILIILGFSGAFAFPFKKIFNKKIIYNIGGIEWKKVRGTKITSYFEINLKKIMERICITYSDTVIIDNPVFKEYIKSKYSIDPKLIEYGGDHSKITYPSKSILKKFSFLNEKYFISVSRAQEDMNIHILINSFIKNPSYKIVIISNWEISKYGRELFNKYYNKYKNIILLKSIYNIDILNIIRSNAFAYIHSHSLCGTAPSLVEAMALKLPVISFDVRANRFTTQNKAKYFKNEEELCYIIRNLDKNKIKELKKEMNNIFLNRYNWKRISKLYEKELNNLIYTN